MGKGVPGSARRLLAINDHILNLTAVQPAEPHVIRIGIPDNFVGGVERPSSAHAAADRV